MNCRVSHHFSNTGPEFPHVRGKVETKDKRSPKKAQRAEESSTKDHAVSSDKFPSLCRSIVLFLWFSWSDSTGFYVCAITSINLTKPFKM